MAACATAGCAPVRSTFRRADAVARRVQDVVDTTRDPVVAIFIFRTSISGKIVGLVAVEIGSHVAPWSPQTVLQAEGHGLARANTPSALLPFDHGTSWPDWASNTLGSTPKNGRQQDPGFIGVTPGNGVNT